MEGTITLEPTAGWGQRTRTALCTVARPSVDLEPEQVGLTLAPSQSLVGPLARMPRQPTGRRMRHRRLRSYLRARSRMVESAAQQILRMQKALTQMNVQLHHVISDLIAKVGIPKAITAMARKLAVLIYRVLKFGSAYLDKGMAYYEQKYQQSKLDYLQRQAAKLGLTLVPNPETLVPLAR